MLEGTEKLLKRENQKAGSKIMRETASECHDVNRAVTHCCSRKQRETPFIIYEKGKLEIAL